MLSPILFIFTFFTLYFLMHLYLYFRLHPRHLVIKLLLILAFLSPLFIRLSDHYLSPFLSFLISFSALFWMGFLLYFIIFDLILRPFTKRLSFSLGMAILFSLYSYYETLKPEVIYLTITSSKIPQETSPFRILQISDLHLGPVMGLDKIDIVKKAVQRFKPQLIVSTGDLVDGNMDNKADLKFALKTIDAPYGKIAIVGNHEYYRGIEKALTFTEDAGFKVLRGDIYEIENFLVIAGLDDDDCRYFKRCKGPLDEKVFLKEVPKGKFVILLKHKPRVNPSAYGLFDLMLSGHTHGGLYYPVGKWLLKYFFDLEYPGLHTLTQGGYLLVSKGLGTGGPPMRFLTPPDLVIIELRTGKESSLPVLQVLSDQL
ncbi:metallophosphoesterase [Caldimicrobium thiodismutans]|uniref:Metallophosphoesterase n=2 Tax=Caldimicrobium thiodismutans TaxID=1653476 RepID=A0A0U5B5N6_9BACT|nr:metallophosphoesterase [Caldimicrobium thiodismutans]